MEPSPCPASVPCRDMPHGRDTTQKMDNSLPCVPSAYPSPFSLRQPNARMLFLTFRQVQFLWNTLAVLWLVVGLTLAPCAANQTLAGLPTPLPAYGTFVDLEPFYLYISGPGTMWGIEFGTNRSADEAWRASFTAALADDIHDILSTYANKADQQEYQDNVSPLAQQSPPDVAVSELVFRYPSATRFTVTIRGTSLSHADVLRALPLATPLPRMTTKLLELMGLAQWDMRNDPPPVPLSGDLVRVVDIDVRESPFVSLVSDPFMFDGIPMSGATILWMLGMPANFVVDGVGPFLGPLQIDLQIAVDPTSVNYAVSATNRILNTTGMFVQVNVLMTRHFASSNPDTNDPRYLSLEELRRRVMGATQYYFTRATPTMAEHTDGNNAYLSLIPRPFHFDANALPVRDPSLPPSDPMDGQPLIPSIVLVHFTDAPGGTWADVLQQYGATAVTEAVVSDVRDALQTGPSAISAVDVVTPTAVVHEPRKRIEGMQTTLRITQQAISMSFDGKVCSTAELAAGLSAADKFSRVADMFASTHVTQTKTRLLERAAFSIVKATTNRSTSALGWSVVAGPAGVEGLQCTPGCVGVSVMSAIVAALTVAGGIVTVVMLCHHSHHASCCVKDKDGEEPPQIPNEGRPYRLQSETVSQIGSDMCMETDSSVDSRSRGPRSPRERVRKGRGAVTEALTSTSAAGNPLAAPRAGRLRAREEEEAVSPPAQLSSQKPGFLKRLHRLRKPAQPSESKASPVPADAATSQGISKASATADPTAPTVAAAPKNTAYDAPATDEEEGPYNYGFDLVESLAPATRPAPTVLPLPEPPTGSLLVRNSSFSKGDESVLGSFSLGQRDRHRVVSFTDDEWSSTDEASGADGDDDESDSSMDSMAEEWATLFGGL